MVVWINLDGKIDWFFMVSLDKEFDLIFEDVVLCLLVVDVENFIENDKVFFEVFVEFEWV